MAELLGKQQLVLAEGQIGREEEIVRKEVAVHETLHHERSPQRMSDAQTALSSPVMAADIGHQFVLDKVHQILGMPAVPVVTPDGSAVIG